MNHDQFEEVALPWESLFVTHVCDGEEAVLGGVDGQTYVATFADSRSAHRYVESAQAGKLGAVYGLRRVTTESPALPRPRQARTIDNVTEAYIFASSGYVNTARRGGAYTSQHPYETATVTLNVGQRMIVERVDQGVMRLEVLP